MTPCPFTPRSSERCSLADSNFVLGNAQVAGLFPVVYCSDGFCDLTGFSRAEVMQRGCACSFLYGPDTSELVRQQIRKALDEHKEFKAELILYRKSGEGPPGQPASPVRSHQAWHPPHPLSLLSVLVVCVSLLIPSSYIPISSASTSPLAPTPPLFHPHHSLSLCSVSHLGFPTPAEKCPHVSRTDQWTHMSDGHLALPCLLLPCSIKPCPERSQDATPLRGKPQACLCLGQGCHWSPCCLGQGGE